MVEFRIRLSTGLYTAARTAVVAVMLASIVLPVAPAHALDPLTLILLRLVRDKVISAGLESAAEHASKAASAVAPSAAGLPLGMNDTQLRRLINEGFIHLSYEQRGEVFSSVRQILMDPANAADGPGIVADLALKAAGVRQAIESISRLSPERKREIAREAGEEYMKLPPDTRDDLTDVLRKRVVPLPDDLNAQILAEIDRVKLTLTTPSKLAPAAP